MTDAGALVAAVWADATRPDPVLTIREWADRHRILAGVGSAEPGPYRTRRTPYAAEIMEALSPMSPYEVVVFQKGGQIGATEIGNNWLGYVIHQAPGPMLFVQPTEVLAKRTSKQRIAPMIASTPALRSRVREARSRDSGNTVLAKEFPGGMVILTGANSATGLRSTPVRYIFFDEIDAYEHDIDGEGDPVAVARRRSVTFRALRKIYLTSTPTLRGYSRIERAFQRTDQRFYYVPCPFCGQEQRIEWARIKWPRDRRERAYLECEGCGKAIKERHKQFLLENGRWLPTAESAERGVVGFHLSALYSPPGWYSWADAAREHKEAREGGMELMKAWVNLTLGETWEEKLTSVDPFSLLAHREVYAADVPDPVRLLTAGVDVQDDRVECEIVGWAAGEESYSIDYAVLYGDPDKSELWNALDTYLLRTWQHENGSQLGVVCTCIDSSGHYTSRVYDYCRDKVQRRVFAIRGMPGENRPLVGAPLQKRSGNRRRPCRLYLLGVDSIKSLIYARLQLTEPRTPGYCHWPAAPNYGEEYFAQLTAEGLRTRYTRGYARKEWVKRRARNEALDVRVYAYAALVILNPVWAALEAAAKRAADQVEADTGPEETPPAVSRLRRRARNFVTDWK